jgi:hypothetical protein
MAAKKPKKTKKRTAQSEILDQLRELRRRREKLTVRLEQERKTLSKLLVKGVAAGAAVSDLAAEAGISRIHAHRVLNLAQPQPATADDGSHIDADAAATNADTAKGQDRSGGASTTTG